MSLFRFTSLVFKRTLSSKVKVNKGPYEDSLNEVTLIGRVGVEPKAIEYTLQSQQQTAAEHSEQDGDGDEKDVKTRRFFTFRLATNRFSHIDAKGEVQYVADWHDIRVYKRNLVKIVEESITKGDRLYVNGAIRYKLGKDKDGKMRLATNIVANDLSILAKKVNSVRKQAPVESAADSASLMTATEQSENNTVPTASAAASAS